MTERNISITFKGQRQDDPWITVTGDDPVEVLDLLEGQEFAALASRVAEAGAEYRGLGNAATLTLPVGSSQGIAEIAVGPTAPAQSTPAPQAQGAAPSGSADLLKNGEHIREQDRFGNTWEYNAPDAPSSPRGPMVKGTKKSKAGKDYTMWYDPAASSAWYPRPRIDKAQQVEAVFAN